VVELINDMIAAVHFKTNSKLPTLLKALRKVTVEHLRKETAIL